MRHRSKLSQEDRDLRVLRIRQQILEGNYDVEGKLDLIFDELCKDAMRK
ncbi:MAG: hypothetical protein NUW37_11925 [Planctomycetes bacterium]|nr:hypothetical protein [Planctomycetota bacterium]